MVAVPVESREALACCRKTNPRPGRFFVGFDSAVQNVPDFDVEMGRITSNADANGSPEFSACDTVLHSVLHQWLNEKVRNGVLRNVLWNVDQRLQSVRQTHLLYIQVPMHHRHFFA